MNFYTPLTPTFHDVSYDIDVTGCLFDPIPPYNCVTKPTKVHVPMNFTGYFIGEVTPVLIPSADEAHGGGPLTTGEHATNMLFGQGIKWCPKENHFVLFLPKVPLFNVRPIGTPEAPYCTLFGPPMMHATASPYGDTSGPVQGSPCVPGVYGSCGSGQYGSSGLSCKEEVFGAKVSYTCQP